MIPDKEIWQAALLLMKRYGADAATQAARRADELLAEGDADGAASWKRIVKAIEELQTVKPVGGRVN
jgi:hypothetical protein